MNQKIKAQIQVSQNVLITSSIFSRLRIACLYGACVCSNSKGHTKKDKKCRHVHLKDVITVVMINLGRNILALAEHTQTFRHTTTTATPSN